MAPQQALANEIAGKPVHRVEFHEITPDAIAHAFASPRQIDVNRGERATSPPHSGSVGRLQPQPIGQRQAEQRGLSAGRVQCVALRLVVEREREILAFVPVEYWTIEAELEEVQISDFDFRFERD